MCNKYYVINYRRTNCDVYYLQPVLHRHKLINVVVIVIIVVVVVVVVCCCCLVNSFDSFSCYTAHVHCSFADQQSWVNCPCRQLGSASGPLP